MKLFVMGLDGASFTLINKFISEGKLPNFKKIIKKGILREMRTTNPPHTAPGWTTAFTGVQQGKHGIYQFWDTQSFEYAGTYMGREHYHVEPVWDILNQFHYKTVMINIPMTYPPKKVDGFIITWPLSNTLRYAYPNEILYDIAKYGGHYASDIQNMFTGDLEYIEQALKITKNRVKTIEYVLEKHNWDVFVSVFTEIDRISHYYWNFMDENSPQYMKTEKKYSQAIEDIYKQTDDAIGVILDKLPKNTVTMIISDHGFTVGKLDFYAQTFLMQNSLLQVKPVAIDEVKKSDDWFGMKRNGEDYSVDWDKTVAYMAAPGSFGININLKGRQKYGIVAKEDYEKVRDKVIRLFCEVKYPDEDKKLFRKVAKREEVYCGSAVEKAPDIILIPHDYSIMVHHALKEDILFGKSEQKGMHDTDAIFGLYGEKINEYLIQAETSIGLEDVAPTILSIFGIKVPDYMEGKSYIKPQDTVQDKRYKQNDTFDVLSKPTRDIYQEKEKDEVAEKLKSLGYL